MSKIKSPCGIEPVPCYIMPDRSSPKYELIIEQLQNCSNSSIGSYYYYIKADTNSRYLCRIIHGGGKVFFHEVIDHEKHSISDDDIDRLLRSDMEIASLPGHYMISPEIEKKLHMQNNQ